jgi:hypothetical protein
MGLDAHLEKWAEWKLAWNRGAWIGRIVSEPKVEMYVATEAWTAGTKGLQRGPLLRAPKDEAGFEAMKGKLAGAFLYRSGQFSDREPNRDEDKAAWHETMKLKELCNQAGILGWVYGAAGGGGYPTRVRVFGNHLTAMKTMADVPTVPEIAVRSDHAKDLVARLDAGKEVVVEFDIQNRFREGPIVLNNVIAELKGSEKPDEVVIVSSHLDSWHQATGTTDNGTGTDSNMESARILTAVHARPKRTIRFCLWGGEEEGLLGSHAYVTQHRTEMPMVSCVFNHDTGTNWAQSMTVTPGMYEPMRRVLAPVLKLHAPDPGWDGPVFHLAQGQLRGGGGSDHASFIAAGVPGLEWGLRGRSDYFNFTWHTQWDTIDVAIEEYQRHTATVIALAALGAADLPALLDHEGIGRSGTATPQGQTMANGAFDAELDGMKFTKVNTGGRADRMGIQVGDVIEKVNGKAVTQPFEVFAALRGEPAPAELLFTLKRGGDSVQATVKAAEFANLQPGRGGRGGGPGGGRGGSGSGRALFQADMQGLEFTKVDEGGRGERLGFRKGDVIVKVNGKAITAPEQIFRVMREEPVPAELAFTVQRGEGAVEVKARTVDLDAGRRGGG